MSQQRRIAVIKEELVALTGSARHAMVLNQILYWIRRSRDVDPYIVEELSGKAAERNSGWIYKSAKQLCSETLLTISERTMRRILADLVAQRLLDRRPSRHRYDRGFLYRPNLRVIQQRLQKLGYTLDEFPSLALDEPAEKCADSTDFGPVEAMLAPGEPSRSLDKTSGSASQSSGQDDSASGRGVAAIPESITESTKQQISSKSTTTTRHAGQPRQRPPP